MHHTSNAPDAHATIHRISMAAFTWLRQTIGPAVGDTPKQLPLDALHIEPHIRWSHVIRTVASVYAPHVSEQVQYELEDHLQDVFDAPAREPPRAAASPVEQDDRYTSEVKRCQYEFQRPYLGGTTLLEHLQSYIWRGARESASDPDRYKFPYITIVQSSGFGKSRLLRELANQTTTHGERSSMRVLYVCVRPELIHTSGYPKTTRHLRDYLFPMGVSSSHTSPDLEDKLVDKLCHLYDYAVSRWDRIGREWFTLFEDQDDAAICAQLQNHVASTTWTAVKRSQILVLAIDEARYLLTSDESGPMNWFRRLRRALSKASQRICDKFGPDAGVFGILVDTHSTIANVETVHSKVASFVPPVSVDHSSRGTTKDESVLFGPFVLTHTMDIRFEELVKRAKAQDEKLTCMAFYQKVVQLEYDEAWRVLVTMGRPLWDRVKLNDFQQQETPTQIIQLAANKLLAGSSAKNTNNFTEQSQFGVAAMLCRMGLRPFSWSPFASRAIADLMAVLVHTSVTHEQLISTYSSDPVLTFGAARLWYQSAKDDPFATLVTYILPQLRKLLRQEVVDTGGVGELVSRILLLLAMDATGVVESSDPLRRQYAGEFRSVKSFLDVLYGFNCSKLVVLDMFRVDVSDAAQEEVTKLLQKWSDWFIGFSHFVQVAKAPDVEMLWMMLARRAAGIFPRNQKGVDLFIPIFKGNTVSMVLVQVKNRADGDPDFPHSASMSMRPSSVFANDDFKQLSPNEVVRIYMNLKGKKPKVSKTFYLVDEGVWHSRRRPVQQPTVDDVPSYVLCLEGLGAWDTVTSDVQKQSIAVVSEALAQELRSLLSPWWDTMKVVEEDLRHRSDRVSVGDDATRYIASRPLVQSLLRGWTSDGISTSDSAVAVANITNLSMSRGPATLVGAKHIAPARHQSDEDDEKVQGAEDVPLETTTASAALATSVSGVKAVSTQKKKPKKKKKK